MTHYTFHAELLPHTEQVVFHKSNNFGQIDRYYVDVHSLEKVDAEDLDAQMMFAINKFDDQLIFKDTRTQQLFVFDKDGIWNKDTLEHPLLY